MGCQCAHLCFRGHGPTEYTANSFSRRGGRVFRGKSQSRPGKTRLVTRQPAGKTATVSATVYAVGLEKAAPLLMLPKTIRTERVIKMKTRRLDMFYRRVVVSVGRFGRGRRRRNPASHIIIHARQLLPHEEKSRFRRI